MRRRSPDEARKAIIVGSLLERRVAAQYHSSAVCVYPGILGILVEQPQSHEYGYDVMLSLSRRDHVAFQTLIVLGPLLGSQSKTMGE